MSAAAIRNAWNRHGVAMGYDLLPADVVVAQSQLETGNFTSDIFRENRNAFGMKLPSVRPTTAIGERRGHAVYRSVEDSVKDYAMRQAAFRIPDGEPLPYMRATVASGYATDPDYVRKWAALVGENPLVVGSFGVGVLLLLLLWATHSD